MGQPAAQAGEGPKAAQPASQPNVQSPESFPGMQSGARFAALTDVGYVREHNEDAYLAAPPLYVVCDGMGGHNAGEVASAIAIDTISNHAPANAEDAEGLEAAVDAANLAIIDAAEDGIGQEGMGCTCTAAIVSESLLTIAQVGDSRAYLLHGGSLQQITRDHSLVADMVEAGEIRKEEARHHPLRSYITRALGLDPYVKSDIYQVQISPGDRLLLCSDGLHSMLEDRDIAKILAEAETPVNTAKALMEAALDAGGIDNVTVVVVDTPNSSQQRRKRTVRKTKATAAIVIAALVVILAGCAIGFNLFVANAAYLGSVDGHVAIYTGLPGSFAGMEFSRLSKVTDVEVADLQPGVARRIGANDIRCDSVAQAEALIESYKQDIEERAGGGSAENAASAGNTSSAGNTGGYE